MKTERVRIKDKSIVQHNIDSIKNLYQHPTSNIDYLPVKSDSLEQKISKLSRGSRSPVRSQKLKK